MLSSMAARSELQDGFLEMIIGPMWAGKTSRLINIYHAKRTALGLGDGEIIAINYVADTRYDQTKGMGSHDSQYIPCVWAEKLCDISNICKETTCRVPEISEKFKEAKILLINECQFFLDAAEWVRVAVEKYNKQVYVCGLDCDYKRNLFGNWLDLVPHADVVTKLKAICAKCKSKNGLYSHRLTNCSQQFLIGTSEYQTLCRRCYLCV